jgi:hypothetical protein
MRKAFFSGGMCRAAQVETSQKFEALPVSYFGNNLSRAGSASTERVGSKSACRCRFSLFCRPLLSLKTDASVLD